MLAGWKSLSLAGLTSLERIDVTGTLHTLAILDMSDCTSADALPCASGAQLPRLAKLLLNGSGVRALPPAPHF